MSKNTTTTTTPAKVAIGIDDTVADVVQLLQAGEVAADQVTAHYLEPGNMPATPADLFPIAMELGQEWFAAYSERYQAIMVAKAKASVPQSPANAIRWMVSKKGAVSIYGLTSRMPVTLYVGQLRRLVKQAFGMEWDRFTSETPLGQWVATDPDREFTIGEGKGEFGEYKSDDELLATYKAGKAPFAVVTGDTVTVGLAHDKL